MAGCHNFSILSKLLSIVLSISVPGFTFQHVDRSDAPEAHNRNSINSKPELKFPCNLPCAFPFDFPSALRYRS